MLGQCEVMAAELKFEKEVVHAVRGELRVLAAYV